MRKVNAVIFVAVSLLLNACAGALVGSGGETGDPVKREQRSVEQINRDASISAEVKAKFAHDSVLRQLNVVTYRGVVRLLGKVPTREVMERAIRIAASVKGVEQVKSGLRNR